MVSTLLQVGGSGSLLERELFSLVWAQPKLCTTRPRTETCNDCSGAHPRKSLACACCAGLSCNSCQRGLSDRAGAVVSRDACMPTQNFPREPRCSGGGVLGNESWPSRRSSWQLVTGGGGLVQVPGGGTEGSAKTITSGIRGVKVCLAKMAPGIQCARQPSRSAL